MQKVDQDPAFNWWVRNMLRKQDRIVAKVRKCDTNKYANTMMNLGIKCLKTVNQYLALDKKNGNTL